MAPARSPICNFSVSVCLSSNLNYGSHSNSRVVPDEWWWWMMMNDDNICQQWFYALFFYFSSRFFLHPKLHFGQHYALKFFEKVPRKEFSNCSQSVLKIVLKSSREFQRVPKVLLRLSKVFLWLPKVLVLVIKLLNMQKCI